MPARVADLAMHRLSRLPSPVADALVTASVIGTEGDVADAGGGARLRRRVAPRPARAGASGAPPRCRAAGALAVPSRAGPRRGVRQRERERSRPPTRLRPGGARRRPVDAAAGARPPRARRPAAVRRRPGRRARRTAGESALRAARLRGGGRLVRRGRWRPRRPTPRPGGGPSCSCSAARRTATSATSTRARRAFVDGRGAHRRSGAAGPRRARLRRPGRRPRHRLPHRRCRDRPCCSSGPSPRSRRATR